jgi:hypothetical protein
MVVLHDNIKNGKDGETMSKRSEEFEVFVEELQEKKRLRARGKPVKYQRTKAIFVGLGDRRKDPSRRSGRVIIVVPANSSVTIFMEEAAATSYPTSTRMSATEKAKKKELIKEERKRIAELRRIIKKLGFIKYRRGGGK